MIDVYVQPGSGKYLKFAKSRLAKLRVLRESIALPAMSKYYVPEPGVRIDLHSADWGDRIRIFREVGGLVGWMPYLSFPSFSRQAAHISVTGEPTFLAWLVSAGDFAFKSSKNPEHAGQIAHTPSGAAYFWGGLPRAVGILSERGSENTSQPDYHPTSALNADGTRAVFITRSSVASPADKDTIIAGGAHITTLTEVLAAPPIVSSTPYTWTSHAPFNAFIALAAAMGGTVQNQILIAQGPLDSYLISAPSGVQIDAVVDDINTNAATIVCTIHETAAIGVGDEVNIPHTFRSTTKVFKLDLATGIFSEVVSLVDDLDTILHFSGSVLLGLTIDEGTTGVLPFVDEFLTTRLPSRPHRVKFGPNGELILVRTKWKIVGGVPASTVLEVYIDGVLSGTYEEAVNPDLAAVFNIGHVRGSPPVFTFGGLGHSYLYNNGTIIRTGDHGPTPLTADGQLTLALSGSNIVLYQGLTSVANFGPVMTGAILAATRTDFSTARRFARPDATGNSVTLVSPRYDATAGTWSLADGQTVTAAPQITPPMAPFGGFTLFASLPTAESP